MSSQVFFKLLAIFVVVAIGWAVGKLKWLSPDAEEGLRPLSRLAKDRSLASDRAGASPDEGPGLRPVRQPAHDRAPASARAGGDSPGTDRATRSAGDPARTLANAAYYIFVPALLFRTTARIDFQTMPWGTLVAVFVPMLIMLVAVYAAQRRANRAGALPVAAPAVRAITAVFGNTVQVGIPIAAALFGEAGLAIHLAIVSLHALVLLTLTTGLVELDLAQAQRRLGATDTHLAATLLATARNTIVHPVVLPVLIGLTWNALGLPLPTVADEILQTLGQAVVPLCLVLIGMSLAHYGVRGAAEAAVWLSALKMLVLPALVLAVAHWGFRLGGLPLAVVVMLSALPVGSNALIFAQRYRALEAETTAATLFSTLAFAAVAPLWLTILHLLG